MCQLHVALKSIFHGSGLCRPVRDDCTVVDASSELMQAQTVATKVLLQGRQVQRSQIFDCLYSELRELFSCDFSNPRQASNRQREHKRFYLPRRLNTDPIRFMPIKV